MKVWCTAVLAAALCGCAAPPRIDHNTRYEGNVSPLSYRHVSGAAVRRNATAEVVGAVAGGVGYAAGGAAVGAPPDTNQATQHAVQAAQQNAARAGNFKPPACAQPAPGSRP